MVLPEAVEQRAADTEFRPQAELIKIRRGSLAGGFA